MGIRLAIYCISLAISGQTIFSQTLGNGSLNGKFNARHLMLTVNSGGTITDARTFYGLLTFDGLGAFTYSGNQIVGTGAPVPASGAGKYSVQSTGYVAMTNFQRTDANLRGGLGQGALVASTQETAGVYDLLIAIPASSSGVTNSALSGAYFTSTLEFPGGTAASVRNAFFQLRL